MNIPEPLQEKIEAWIEKRQPKFDWDYRGELGEDNIKRLIKNPDAINDIENEILDFNCRDCV